MKIESIPIDQINKYENNPRTHSAEQIDLIAASVGEFGWTNPLLIDDDNRLIAGHGRLEAAIKLKMSEVPTIRLSDLTEDQKRGYVIADNKLAMNAGWDNDLLKLELAEIRQNGFNLELVGFNSDELNELFKDNIVDGLTDEDAVPELPSQPITVLGDIWVLGNHRLMCGDTTIGAQVDRLMSGQKADLVWTDPPYNVNYEGGTGMTIQNDSMCDSAFKQFLLDSFSAAFSVTKAGRPVYVAHADSEGANFRVALKESGYLLKQCLVWVKNSMVLGRQDYQWQHEPILYGWKPGEAHKWYGGFDKKTVIDDDVDLKKMDKSQLVQIVNDYRNQKNSTVIRESKPSRNDMHPTMKPVALVQRMILNSSREEDTVLDLFGGGGSTMIACEKTNRNCYMMELDPKYCDVIIKRWEEFTGKKATNART